MLKESHQIPVYVISKCMGDVLVDYSAVVLVDKIVLVDFFRLPLTALTSCRHHCDG